LNGVADQVGDLIGIDTLTRHEPGSKLSVMLPSRRNQPVMECAGVNDAFIPYNITRERADAYAQGTTRRGTTTTSSTAGSGSPPSTW
jgi:hypothetical protein